MPPEGLLQLDEEGEVDRGTMPWHSTLHSVTIKTLSHGRRQAINLESRRRSRIRSPAAGWPWGWLGRASQPGGVK